MGSFRERISWQLSRILALSKVGCLCFHAGGIPVTSYAVILPPTHYHPKSGFRHQKKCAERAPQQEQISDNAAADRGSRHFGDAMVWCSCRSNYLGLFSISRMGRVPAISPCSSSRLIKLERHKFFTMCTYEKRARKPFAMCTYERLDLKSFGFCTYKK